MQDPVRGQLSDQNAHVITRNRVRRRARYNVPRGARERIHREAISVVEVRQVAIKTD